MHNNTAPRQPRHMCSACCGGGISLSPGKVQGLCQVRTQSPLPRCPQLLPPDLYPSPYRRHGQEHICSPCQRRLKGRTSPPWSSLPGYLHYTFSSSFLSPHLLWFFSFFSFFSYFLRKRSVLAERANLLP